MTDEAERDARIDKAISALDLSGKVRLLTGAALFSLHAEPVIGLAELRLSDGPTGVRGADFTGGDVACLLPNATLIAQTWRTEIAEEVGTLLAEEAQARRTHVVLGPTINLHRTPLGGRLFEAFSEDPLLTGVLAAAYVRALQRHGIGATPKHFVANEAETERMTVDSIVDERTLREIYLLPFEIVVTQARPWAVMASYNRVNGTFATEHDELVNGVLKGEWEFDGLVMSDWFATRSAAASANGGLDLVMPGPAGPWGGALVRAVRAGEVAEETVDEHLRRLLRLADRVGAVTPAGAERDWSRDVPAPAGEPRRTQLRELAASGMTVLVNRDATLPLGTDGTVALIGEHATHTIGQGGGSARVRAPHVVSIADALNDRLGDHLSIVDGVPVRKLPAVPKPGTLRDPVTGADGMRVTTKDVDGAVLESRHVEVAEVSFGFGGWLNAAAQIELTAEVVLAEPTRLRVGVRGAGTWTLRAGELTWNTELPSGDGLGADLLLPPFWTEEAELRPGATLVATVRGLDGPNMLGLAAGPAHRSPAAIIADAAHAASGAELAIVVVGLTEEQETEAVDKTTLALPGEQDAMVAAVAGVAKRTVVVVNAATPVLMPWLREVDAVLWAGLPGQEAGAAVAAALLGEIEPAGRLVTTFPARDGTGPAWSPVPHNGELRYTEGMAIGYRGWDRQPDPAPLFWFGHGLGYTEWTYGSATLTTTDSGTVHTVTVELANSGARESREVVQVYLRPADQDQPVRLIGWNTVELAAGARTTVTVTCDPHVQRGWDTTKHAWRALQGEQVLIARGLGDVRVTMPVRARKG